MTALISLFRQCFPFAHRENAELERILSDRRVHRLYEKEGDRLIAAALILEDTLLLLAVLPTYRRRGIGSRLLKAAEAYVRSQGFAEIAVGSGKAYLLPGVPSQMPIFAKASMPPCAFDGIDPDARSFFEKRGYRHAWADADCFDMTLTFAERSTVTEESVNGANGIEYRFAKAEELTAVTAAMEEAHRSFARYYAEPSRYTDRHERVLIALDGEMPIGALIVKLGKDAENAVSLAAVAVLPAYRGRGIAKGLVSFATAYGQRMGMTKGFVGYTYSGLDRLYGSSGYTVAVYYMMAKKHFGE